MADFQRFADRLEPGTFAEDEPVHVFCPETQAEAWVPGPLFNRMKDVAHGYRLHVIPQLAPDALRFLNVCQAESLADELAFLQQVTNDAALHEQLASIMSVAADGIYHASKSAIAFDWP